MSYSENPFEKLSQQISILQKTVDALTENSKQTIDNVETNVWLTLDDLCQYLPDKPAKSTLYLKLSKGELPGHKTGKKWYFYKNDIDVYLKTGKVKTTSDIEVDVENYLSKK